MDSPFSCNTASIIKIHSKAQNNILSPFIWNLQFYLWTSHPPSKPLHVFWLTYNRAWVCAAPCLCVCGRETERTNLSLLPNHFTLHWGPSSFVNGLLVETRQAETLETWPQPLKGTALPFSSGTPPSPTPILVQLSESCSKNNWHTNI